MAGHNQGVIELEEIIEHFATAMNAADNRGPRALNPLTKRIYQPGIGPHPEDRAVDLVMSELAVQRPHWRSRVRACHPASGQRCDWLLGEPLQWAIEIRMARANHDNGKPHDAAIRDVLSPYPDDRSALSDCVRLARSGISERRAILIYGFDDSQRPLSEIISAFQTLAQARVNLGAQRYAPLGRLVHPVHRSGGVYGWEIHSDRGPS
jgi:hypothetical protein